MITKAIVEQIDRNNPYTAKVRIPIFNKQAGVVGATPTDQLYTASISCLPNCSPNIRVGDVVFVSFEDNYIDKPIILGHLYNGVSNLGTYTGLKLDSVEATVDAKFPKDTSIGNTTPNDFINIQNTRDNLQGQIDTLGERLVGLNSYVDIATAEKPWISGKIDNNTNLVKVSFPDVKDAQGEIFQESAKFSYATNKLLYIETDDVPYGGSYTIDLIHVKFELENISNLTQEQKTFENYFNKNWNLISAYSLAQPLKNQSGTDKALSIDDNHRYIVYADKIPNTTKEYKFMLSLNPEYYYSKRSSVTHTEWVSLTTVQEDHKYSFTLKNIPSETGGSTSTPLLNYIYGTNNGVFYDFNSLYTFFPEPSNKNLIAFNSTGNISPSSFVSVSYNEDLIEAIPSNANTRYGFLFALSD